MTKIDFREYRPGYMKYLEKNNSIGKNTVQKRKNMIHLFFEKQEKQDLIIETENLYESVDKILHYLKRDDVKVHDVRVTALRDFLIYIKSRVDSRTGDQLIDIRDKVSKSEIVKNNKNKDNGKLDKEKLKGYLLSNKDFKKAKNFASDRTELIIDFMMDTACRAGEVVAARPKDLNFEDNSFYVRRTWSAGDFKDSPKNNSFRKVQFRNSVSKRLREYIESNEIAENEELFPSYRCHVYNPIKDVFTKAEVRLAHLCTGQCKEYYEEYQEICDKCGKKVSEEKVTKTSPHWVRHNACTRFANNSDNSINRVREYLGHEDLETTQIYLEVNPDEVIDIDISW